MHHGPVPGQQLSPRRPAEQPCLCPAAKMLPVTQSHAQCWGQAACHCRIFSPAHLVIPGWTISCHWLILAVLSVCRQRGLPEELAGRGLPPIQGPDAILTKALSLQSHPCPSLEGDCSGLWLWLAHTCRAWVPAQHVKMLPFCLKHKSCFSPYAQKERKRGD